MKRPNFLFFMVDQMQGRTLEPGHPCITPNLDALAARGVRITNAYTPNAVCSPARASLMTGLLPHNHGVLEVTHVVDDDQSCLRTDRPHWAQRLRSVGYFTGYFGKWHVERTSDLSAFGWSVNGELSSPLMKERAKRDKMPDAKVRFSLEKWNERPPGYKRNRLYGVTNEPPESRGMGITTSLALDFLDEALEKSEPWCCFVSFKEPHDPFIAGEEAFSLYDVDSIPLPPNVFDDLQGRPGLYRKSAAVWEGMTEREKREAAACYYASITEIDGLFGRLIARIEEAGALEDTIVIVTSDHGELLGAHGLYCKNISAFEEVYNIPMVFAGPGIAKGEVAQARVGLHDLCPTILECAGLEPFDVPDSRSFRPALQSPSEAASDYTQGFAEYHGGRYRLTQRVVWDGPWKYVHNGFDFDELYNLDDDPYEMNNLAGDPNHDPDLRRLSALMWKKVRETGDHSLLNTTYPPLRLAPYGPEGTDG